MLIINKNIAHNIKRCNTPSKNFLFFSFQEYYTRLFCLRYAFCLRCRSALPSLQVRCKSVPMNGRKMGLTQEVHGRKKGEIVQLWFLGCMLMSIIFQQRKVDVVKVQRSVALFYYTLLLERSILCGLYFNCIDLKQYIPFRR